MAKEEMNAFDVAAVVHELTALVGARLDKVFQPTRGEVLLRLRVKSTGDEGSRRDLAVLVGKAVTLTKVARENPTEPPSFAMQLRRHLTNARLVDVRQHHFDRVVELEFERAEGRWALVIELFHDGNVILVREGRILAALLVQSWATRDVRPGAEYQPAPPRERPTQLPYDAFRTRLLASQSDAVRTLATEFNLGGQYAEDVCSRAGVPKNKATGELVEQELEALHAGLVALVARLERGEFEPVVVLDGETVVDVAPWELIAHSKKGRTIERVESVAEALDRAFAPKGVRAGENAALRRFRDEYGKVERQLAQQLSAVTRFVEQEEQAKHLGNLLYAHFQPASAAIEYVSALGKSLGWKDALERLEAARAEGRPEAMLVERVLPKEAAAVLLLTDEAGAPHKVRVDFRKNLQENANIQYEKAKKVRDKQAGAKEAMVRTRARLAELDRKGERLEEDAARAPEASKQVRRFWFEAFRWFRTSDGFMVVGGRDAGSNERLVRKHLKDDDRYLHADLHGAPSIVVKGEGREITETALAEAAEFGVMMSKAWGAGHASGEAYWVLPSQVSKTPNPGEFVAKGAFIVRGKRQYATVDVRYAAGIVDIEGTPKLMGGPEAAVKAQAQKFVRLVPGDEPPNTLAPRLAKAFGTGVEEVQAVLPPGGSRVVEARGVDIK